MPSFEAFYGCTVTVPTSPTSLLALIQALGGRYANIPSSCRSYQIQPDTTNTVHILVGDAAVAVSTQNCAMNLPAATSFLDRASVPGMAPLGSLWVVAVSSGTALLNVAIMQE